MNDAVPPPLPALPSRPAWRPLHGFGPVFTWGFTRVLSKRKLLLVSIIVVALAGLIGWQISHHPRVLRALARRLDLGVLSFGIPLIALVLVSDGFAREVQSRTLVYHLVRPVSRVTVFLARFFSGALPATCVSLLLLVTIVLASGATVGAEVWLSLPATAALGTFAVGAVYYALAAVLRHGIIAGLVYTFVVETLISSVPGSMQKFSVMFHVRSLHHGLTAGSALPRIEPKVEANPMLRAATRVTENGVGESIVILLAITAACLAIGAWRVAVRDWALKD